MMYSQFSGYMDEHSNNGTLSINGWLLWARVVAQVLILADLPASYVNHVLQCVTNKINVPSHIIIWTYEVHLSGDVICPDTLA